MSDAQLIISDTIEKLEDLVNYLNTKVNELEEDRYTLAVALATITGTECCSYGFKEACDLATEIIHNMEV